jgi:hypothetical protein
MAGPLAERGCTDIIVLLLFIANIIFLGYCELVSYLIVILLETVTRMVNHKD